MCFRYLITYVRYVRTYLVFHLFIPTFATVIYLSSLSKQVIIRVIVRSNRFTVSFRNRNLTGTVQFFKWKLKFVFIVMGDVKVKEFLKTFF